MAAAQECTRIAGIDVLRSLPDSPNGRSLLFVHGAWVGGSIWQNYLRFFAERGYACYALTLRGHDRPFPGIGKVSFYEYVDDVVAVARALDAPILIGHSLGGLLVQKALETLCSPAAVLLAPTAPRGIFAITSAEHLKLAVLHAHEMLLGLPVMPGQAAYAALAMNRLPSTQHDAFYRALVPDSGHHFLEMAILGVPVDATKVNCPLLCEVGEEDRLTPLTVVRSIARKYGATLREHPGHAHMLNIEPGWEAVAENVAEWLDEIPIARKAPAATS
ncbi:MAG: alpha/beta hydrolase [Chloroflexota bacterium]